MNKNLVNRDAKVIRVITEKAQYVIEDVESGFRFNAPDQFLRRFCTPPTTQLDNGLIKEGTVLHMVVKDIDTNPRYYLDNNMYESVNTSATTRPRSAKKSMSEEILFENAKLYEIPNLDQLKAMFAVSVSNGKVDHENYIEILNIMKEGNEQSLQQALLTTLNIFHIGLQERKELEFKSSFYHLPPGNEQPQKMVELFRQICSYGNSDNGGCILVGVKDDGSIVGIEKELLYECPFSSRERFEDDFINRLNQKVDCFDFVSTITFEWFRTHENKLFCKINVPAYKKGVILYGSELFVRTNTGMKLLVNREHTDFIINRYI